MFIVYHEFISFESEHISLTGILTEGKFSYRHNYDESIADMLRVQEYMADG